MATHRIENATCCCPSCSTQIALIRSYGYQQYHLWLEDGTAVTCDGELMDFSEIDETGSARMTSAGTISFVQQRSYDCDDGAYRCQTHWFLGTCFIACDEESQEWVLYVSPNHFAHYCYEFPYTSGYSALCYYHGEAAIPLEIGDDGKLTGTYTLEALVTDDGTPEICLDSATFHIEFNP